MSRIIIPYLNTVKFHKKTPDETAKYLSKHMDDWNFSNTVPGYQIRQQYLQLFQKSDTIEFQCRSSFTTHTAKLVNGCGAPVQTITMTQGAESTTEPGLFIYTISQDLADIAEGRYYITINCDDEIILISEPIYIKEVHENSILIEYTHSKEKDGFFFQTGQVLQLRVGGSIRYKEPASKDTTYEDQSFDTTTLDSVSYRVWELYVAGNTGIPDYLIDKINRALGCDSLMIEGRYYARPEGAKLEPKTADDYSLKGWSVDLHESENLDSIEYSTDAPVTPPSTTQLDTPVLSFSYISSSQLSITWPAILHADSYTVLMGTINDFAFATVVSSGTNTYFPATGLPPAKRQYFWVRAEGSGLYSPSLYATANEITLAETPAPVALSAPALVMVANGSDKIDASWSADPNATGFEFYLNDTNDFGSATLQYSGTGTSKNVTGLTANTTYYGWVRALGNLTTYSNSPYSTSNATTDAVDPSTITFDTILTGNGVNDSETGTGINAYFVFQFFTPDKEFHFNKVTPIEGVGIRLTIKVGSSTGAIIDFLGCYSGSTYKYVHSTGTAYYGVFPTVNKTETF